ncbi:hypothetical protein IKQ19_13525, partial [Candidatus Saccharibacteria bacterium]|nr:hypothetical protein [Candidatus Saccharibacteria bacterium]
PTIARAAAGLAAIAAAAVFCPKNLFMSRNIVPDAVFVKRGRSPPDCSLASLSHIPASHSCHPCASFVVIPAKAGISLHLHTRQVAIGNILGIRATEARTESPDNQYIGTQYSVAYSVADNPKQFFVNDPVNPKMSFHELKPYFRYIWSTLDTPS